MAEVLGDVVEVDLILIDASGVAKARCVDDAYLCVGLWQGEGVGSTVLGDGVASIVEVLVVGGILWTEGDGLLVEVEARSDDERDGDDDLWCSMLCVFEFVEGEVVGKSVDEGGLADACLTQE